MVKTDPRMLIIGTVKLGRLWAIMIVILSSILFDNQLLVLVVEEKSKLGTELLYE